MSMMSYRLWERKENSCGGLPVERPHGEVVILSLSDSQLFLKILKGIEGMAVMVVSRVMRKIKEDLARRASYPITTASGTYFYSCTFLCSSR